MGRICEVMMVVDEVAPAESSGVDHTNAVTEVQFHPDLGSDIKT